MRLSKNAAFLTAFLLLAAAAPAVPAVAGLCPAVTAAAEEAPQKIADGDLNASIHWELDNAGTLTITGSGDMSEITGGFSSSVKRNIQRAVIQNTDAEHTLTAIGAELFKSCTALTEVTIPDTVTVIGNSAFYDCTALSRCNFPVSLLEIGDSAFAKTALTELKLPGCTLGADAFLNCLSLKTVEIGEGTKVIPTQCFRWCTSLETVTLPDSVKSIECGQSGETGAFYYCKKLKNVSIGTGIESIHNCAFRTESVGLTVTFRDGVTAIPANSFKDRYELTEVVLPDSLTTIADTAFYNCKNLSECKFPESLLEIGNSAFFNSALTELELPGCTLGENAFLECQSLKTVKIGEGTKVIPTQCFRRCTSLETVTLPDSVKSIECGQSGETGAFYYCKKLKNVSIGSGIESIHNCAFRTEAVGLTVTFRDGVTAIPENSFKDRYELTKVVLPNTLTTIADTAFYNCKNLSECNFPKSLQKIGNSAFFNSALTELELPGCTLGENAFLECQSLKTVKINEGTKVIPTHCFRWCTSLESVWLPDSVKSIECGSSGENGAFYYCKKLKNVSIGTGIESIHNCAFRTEGTDLTVTFRDGVTAIPENSFKDRYELTKVVLPDSLTTIADNAFYNCKNLNECNFPKYLQKIGNSAFFNAALTELKLPGCALGENAFLNCLSLKTVKIDEGTKVIPTQCFRWCTALESVWLPDSVKSIECGSNGETGAFYYCKNLKTVSIGENIETIDCNAFRTCGDTLEVTFREGVKAVPANAFYGRNELTKVVLPDTLTTIADNAFNNCKSLSECNFPKSLQKIGNSAFYNAALTELELPGCALEANAFMNCQSLKTVTIGEGTEVIPTQCFRWCTALENVTLPNSIQSIECGQSGESGAFYYCKELKTVSIGKDIETINGNAFRTCGKELEVTFREGAKTIPAHAFDNSPLTVLNLPESMTAIAADAVSSYSGLTLISIQAKDCDIADSASAIPAGARIRAYADSTAQQYAEQYGRVFETFDADDPVIAYGNCVTGASLTLNGRIGVNFYATLNSNAVKVELECMGVKVVYSGEQLAAAKQADGTYKFTFSVNAPDASEKVYLRIYDASNKRLDIYNSRLERASRKEIAFSVADYIEDSQQYSSDLKLKDMVEALDTYCKAAENYFRKTGTDYPLDIPDADYVMTNQFNKQFKIALVLNSGTALRIYSDAKNAVRIQGNEEIPLTAVKRNANTQYYEIPDISAFNLLENEKIKLDGVTYTVCPIDYCALILSKDNSTQKLRDVCNALYYYSVAAQAYKNSLES